MPFGQISEPNLDHATYFFNVTCDVPDAQPGQQAFFSAEIGFMNTALTSEVDPWFQALVDKLSELPGLASISAQKSMGGGAQECTPTPPEE